VSDTLRVSFVGRASETGHAVPAAPVPGLDASFVEHRAGQPGSRVLAHVAEHDPHAVVVFGVASLPAETVRAIGVPVVAWVTAPDRPPGLEHHPDLPDSDRRHRAGLATAADYERVIDRPLPVADEHFATGLGLSVVPVPKEFGDVGRDPAVPAIAPRHCALPQFSVDEPTLDPVIRQRVQVLRR